MKKEVKSLDNSKLDEVLIQTKILAYKLDKNATDITDNMRLISRAKKEGSGV